MSDFAQIRFQPNRPLLRELSADRLNTILQEIRRNKPKGERGITVRQDGTGTYIGLAAALPRGASTPSTRQPWDIYVSGSEGEGESEQYKLKVQPGTCNFFLPTNWDSEWLADKNQLAYGILEVATDGQFITGTSIQIGQEPPENQTPEKFGLQETISVVFGLFKDGKSYNLTGGSNLDLSATAVLATSADPPAQPGESAFDIYYRLQ
jgi:hypothetical protein